MSEVSDKAISARILEWRLLRKKHFKTDKSETISKNSLRVEMPPGHLRQIMKSRGDMSHAKFAGEKRMFIGALRYAPHAVLKLFENMPMPWEEIRMVNVIYHVAGALTLVNEVPKVVPPQYIAQWSTMWIAMRREKRDRMHFRRIEFPPFDDEEPPLDFVSNIDGLPPPEPILLDLDPEEDSSVIDWFYDHLGLARLGYTNGISYKTWRFPPQVMATLYRLARPLVGDYIDPNSRFLFDLPSLITSKSLNEVIPGGPRFEPLYKDDDGCWDEFNDARKIIVRHPITTECRVAFPHLYNSRPRAVSMAPYRYPASCYVTGDTEGFMIDASISPIEISDNPYNYLEDSERVYQLSEDQSTNSLTKFGFNGPFKKLFLTSNSYLTNTAFNSSSVSENISLLFSQYPFSSLEGKTQRQQDVPLIRSWYKRRSDFKAPQKVRVSHQKLLKNHVANVIHSKTSALRRKPTLADNLSRTPFFQHTTLDWLEAGLFLVQQGYNMINLLIRRHRLSFLHLDWNFGLKPTKTLNTKERRKSRFGNGFHLLRELFRFTKLIVDVHTKYRLGSIDAYTLADGINYALSHVGFLTGMYRYKYRVMRQIRQCKDLKHLIRSRFSPAPGPGNGFWAPLHRTWVFFLRGIIPLLETWLGNRVAREYEGRKIKKSRVTKQRAESNFDLELRQAVMHDILDSMPPALQKTRAHSIMSHMSEAWRCWKANLPWKVPGLPPPLEQIILRYVKMKADWWVSGAHAARRKILREGTVDKALLRKSSARMTRLYLRRQADIQASYLKDGPEVSSEEGVALLINTSNYLEHHNYQVIPFPPLQYRNDTKILSLALESLRSGHDVTARMNQVRREELAMIEYAYDNPHETLNKIKRSLFSQRTFRDVGFDFLDSFDNLIPVYDVDATEKITDAYLDQYLWYEADRRGLFREWVKPSDSEPPPITLYRFCEKVDELIGKGIIVVIESEMEGVADRLDLTLANYLLRLVMDRTLADYITAKSNVMITYKDMSVLNSKGLILGLQFSSFVFQYISMVYDILILGSLSRVWDSSNPIKHYMRFHDKVHIVLQLSNSEADELISRYPSTVKKTEYGNKKCWPVDCRMRLGRRDTAIGWAAYQMFAERLPPSMVSLKYGFSSVMSDDNPRLMFEMCDFDVLMGPESSQTKTWQFQNSVVSLRVCERRINQFKFRIKQILLSSQATTFAKAVSKWNSALVGLVTYFREAIPSTPELLDELVRSESRVQGRIKLGLNSKMPNRFPPVVFYAPRELGGLGMLSAGHVLIPEKDIAFRSGLTGLIPAIFNYVRSWSSEISDSARAWQHYATLRVANRRVSPEDLDSLWDRGIPRISTLFQKDRRTLVYDKGWRIRALFKKYSVYKTNPLYWTHFRHDGKLWNLSDFRSDVVQALGGIQGILQHSLFPATGFTSVNGVIWDDQDAADAALKTRKMTNAQRLGLAQVPNRRFTLWWSPTINRADVYVGFRAQLDLTGIMMHGKIPTLKVSLIQLFRGHLWQKVHESIVMDVSQAFDRSGFFSAVSRQETHPRKSYKFNAGAADIVCILPSQTMMSEPSFPIHEGKNFEGKVKSSRIWIDVQLRWGDYDAHDAQRYARSRFLSLTMDPLSTYPSVTGIIIVVDLCYGVWGAYGNWVKGLSESLEATMKAVMKFNPTLAVLRERVRRSLGLRSSTPTTAAGVGDLTSGKTWVVEDANVYRVKVHKSFEGNHVATPVNGCLTVINPSTGFMVVRVIHSAVWRQQKRTSQLAKWKAAEETLSLIRTLPVEERPKEVVCARELLVDPLSLFLAEFPNTVVKSAEMDLPTSAFMKHPTVSTLVAGSSEPVTALFNLYDNWLDFTSPHHAFARAMLLLRGLHLVGQRLWEAVGGRPEGDKMWPVLDADGWADAEIRIRDVVIGEYCRRNSVNPASLTQSEIRDIIMGVSVSKPGEEREAIAAEEVVAVRTVNKEGDEVIVQAKGTLSKFEEKGDWRVRALRSAKATKITLNDGITGTTRGLAIPSGIIKKLVSVSDVWARICCLLYGKDGEIMAAVMPPQAGGKDKIDLPSGIPHGDSLEGMEFIGVAICRREEGTGEMDEGDEEIAIKLSSPWVVVVGLGLGTGEVKVRCFENKEEGAVVVSDDLGCWFAIPEGIEWNLSFNPSRVPEGDYSVTPGIPAPFFDMKHRPGHFTRFAHQMSLTTDTEFTDPFS